MASLLTFERFSYGDTGSGFGAWILATGVTTDVIVEKNMWCELVCCRTIDFTISFYVVGYKRPQYLSFNYSTLTTSLCPIVHLDFIWFCFVSFCFIWFWLPLRMSNLKWVTCVCVWGGGVHFKVLILRFHKRICLLNCNFALR